MATKTDILAALGSLDPEQQEHWTEQGLPAMEVVKELLGEEITRKELTAAAPLFNRESLELGESQQKQEEPPAKEEPEIGEDELETLREKLAKADEAQHEARRKAEAAKAEQEEAQRAYDKAQRDLEAADARTNAEKTQDEIMAVIRSNNERKQAAAAKRQELIDAGLGPAVNEMARVLGGTKAPVDQALKNRPRQVARAS